MSMQFKIQIKKLYESFDIIYATPIVNPNHSIAEILNDDDAVNRFIIESGDNLESNIKQMYIAYKNRYKLIRCKCEDTHFDNTSKLMKIIVSSDNPKIVRIIKRINLEYKLNGGY